MVASVSKRFSTFRFFVYFLLCSVVPPFSDFFCVVLENYQIHALCLRPEAILLLANFAYLCEAFLGVMPSVALFRAFYNLKLTAVHQCSGCVSFRIIDEAALDMIPMGSMREVKVFR